jgi:uncharacterized protein YndB with AHSA1/START domain
MTSTEFVYVTYIAADPKRVWDALLRSELTRKYWGHDNVSDWKPGSKWEHRQADESRKVRIAGKVLESDPPRRLVLTWNDPAASDAATQSRVTIELEPIEDMVRLTITHDQLVPGSDMHRKIAAGWPRVLSSLKSLLETGRPLATWATAKS